MSGWVDGWAAAGFPWGTFLVNLVGSMLLGAIIKTADMVVVSTEVRAMLTIGFCGSFTTFSTFTFETVTLLQKGLYLRAAVYALGSLVLGLIGLWLGMRSAGMLARLR
jgi:CrcB protein